MFSISLQFSGRLFFSGIDSLDISRRLGVSDGPRTVFSEAAPGSRSVEVTEGFARRYFDRASLSEVRSVPVDLLMPGDVARSPDPDRLEWAKNISDARIIELFTICDDRPAE